MIRIQFAVAGRGALDKRVVALNAKNLARIKSGLVELPVYIGRNYKVRLALYRFIYALVKRQRLRNEAGVINMSGPVGPALLFRFKFMEGRCVQVREAVALNHIGKGRFEGGSTILEARCRCHPGTGPDKDIFSASNGCLSSLQGRFDKGHGQSL